MVVNLDSTGDVMTPSQSKLLKIIGISIACKQLPFSFFLPCHKPALLLLLFNRFVHITFVSFVVFSLEKKTPILDWYFNFFQLSMDFSQHGAEIFVPGEAFASNSATQASTIVYKTLNNILTLEKEGAKNEEKNRKTKLKSVSSIVSATILPRPVTPMRKPIKFVFYHKYKARNISTSQRSKCFRASSSLSELARTRFLQHLHYNLRIHRMQLNYYFMDKLFCASLNQFYRFVKTGFPHWETDIVAYDTNVPSNSSKYAIKILKMWNNIHVKYVSKLVCSKINSCTGRFYTPDSRQYATSSLGYSDYAPYQIMKKKEVVIWIRTNKNSIQLSI